MITAPMVINFSVPIYSLSARGTVETTSEADWDRVSLNTKSVFLVSKFAVPHLRAAGGGAIVNISSTGVHAETNRVAYGTAKGAIIMMTKLMALDRGPDAIRVNCISPGVTETSLSQGNRRREAERRGITLDEVNREITSTYPLGRTGDTSDIANGALYLVSDEAGWVTGASRDRRRLVCRRISPQGLARTRFRHAFDHVT